MSATTSATKPRAAVPQPPKGPAAPPARRRWPRLVVPYALVVVLLLITAGTYARQQPDRTDAAFLSPTARAGIGGSRLADALRARGVAVERHTRTADALVAAHRGGATLFVPAPDLVHAHYLRMFKLMPATTTVVLVRPAQQTLARGHLPVTVLGDAWAAAAVPPGCADPVATAAGPAAALRARYDSTTGATLARCYRGGLLRAGLRVTTLAVVGATEPFRNDRFDEVGNAALAVGLLAGAARVVWLDLHGAEPGPAFDSRSGLDPTPAPASLGRGSPDPDFPVPDPEGTAQGGNRDAPPPPQGAREKGSTVFDLFPAATWTVLALVVLAALLAAAARARRLGAPVSEPLPVLVPSTETVTGRGRLYERSGDRGAAVAVLRVAARDRLARLLDRPPDVPAEELVPAVAAHTRRSPDEVRDLLYGGVPADDAALVSTAVALDALVAAVTRVPEGEAT